MLLKHFFVKKIAHSSYLLAGRSACAIVDPERNIDVYLDAARSLGLRITHVVETHLHADFVSGHMDIRERTGAAIVAPRAAECAFDHVGVGEGDSIEIEDIRIDVLETPGHTPEHVSYVATDTARGDGPACVFTGDTLFVGDVGRPDLFPGRAHELASKLYDSVHEKLLKLPDYCEVLPAHGAGSLCGHAMAAKWTSTIGYERRFNPSLRIRSRERFIESLTSDMPPAPDHFGTCTGVNGEGPSLVSRLPRPARLGPKAFRERSGERGAIVLDVRPYDAYGGQHIPNALSIPLEGNFATFAGWVVPERVRVLMVAENHEQALDAAGWLWRVGLDRVEAYLDGGMYAWAKAGYPTAHVAQLSAEEVHEMTVGRKPFTLIDVRAPHEYAASHIDGAINVPAPDLRTRHTELDGSVPTVLMCSSGNRSSLAASILESKGFDKLVNAAGGYAGYAALGFGEPCAICAIPHGPRLVEVGARGGRP